MSLAAFAFTGRCRPVVEVGIGDTRVDTGVAKWDVGKWDNTSSRWASSEPTWLDVTCDTFRFECSYGHAAVLDRFVAGTATILVDNSSGWADPFATTDLATLDMRPGRAVRVGVMHETLGYRPLFRGFIDAVSPTYDPTRTDVVQLDCIDALGEVGRAKTVALEVPTGTDAAAARITRILDRAQWPLAKRDISPSSVALIPDDLGGQVADLLGIVSESVGGAVFGDQQGRVCFRSRDWQAYKAGSPPDGTIGNVAASDVCPVSWVRPFDRSDIATRVILGRAGDAPSAYKQADDAKAQLLYGIEPFERTYLVTSADTYLAQLSTSILETRGYATAPRVRSVALDARTAVGALDLMASVDVYKPSRYRCRLQYAEPHGLAFDAEYFATSVHHTLTPTSWSLELGLDVAAPYARTTASTWDFAQWDNDLWSQSVAEVRALLLEMTGALS